MSLVFDSKRYSRFRAPQKQTSGCHIPQMVTLMSLSWAAGAQM